MLKNQKRISTNAFHRLPEDLQKALNTKPKALVVWKDITPLARNEWICWVISGKKEETRKIRIQKTLSKLSKGMSRPCCWAGCPHRFKQNKHQPHFIRPTKYL